MATVPQPTKDSLEHRLAVHARTRWPQLAGLRVRHRAAFTWIDAEMPDGEVVPLIRLRYLGSADDWASASTWPAATSTRTRSCPLWALM
jgi:hypothetical protein